MTLPAITVKNLSKQYVLGGEVDHQKTFREMLTGLAREPLRRLRKLRGSSKEQETFWALKDISFEVKPGEVLGIIGRNGAGKSTLLKILSRITAPTTGEIEYRGRLASLLEVGTGFHPELSGRENIFINGAILGMAKAEITKKFDEIVDFAGIEPFLDTPVKRYSSGMYVRLAFSVAAHLDPDILVVDEVLAVGDAEFQKKCLGKMKSVSAGGRTVLFVSHNMGAVNELCDQCLWLDRGMLTAFGVTSQTVFQYFTSGNKELCQDTFQGDLAASFDIKELRVNDKLTGNLAQISPADSIEVLVRGVCRDSLPDVRMSLTISREGIRLATLTDTDEFTHMPAGYFACVFRLPAYLLRPGEYMLGFGGDREKSGYWFYGDNLACLRIIEQWDDDCRKMHQGVINVAAVADNRRLTEAI